MVNSSFDVLSAYYILRPPRTLMSLLPGVVSEGLHQKTALQADDEK